MSGTNGKTPEANQIYPCELPLPPCTVESFAENWVFRWPGVTPERSVMIEVLGYREAKEGIYSEIMVSRDSKGGGVLVPLHGPTRINLQAARTRKELANQIEKVCPKVLWEPPANYLIDNPALNKPHYVRIRWYDLVEQVCREVQQRSKDGNPVLDLRTDVIVEDVVEYLVENCVPLNHTSVIYADGGVGKSWIAEYLGVLIATGLTIPPFRPTRQLKVLYLDYEVDEKEVKRRLMWIANGLGLSVEDLQDTGGGGLFYYRRQERPVADDLVRLRQEIARLGIGAVIIDSLGPAIGGDVLKAEAPIRAMNAIRALGTVTKIVVAHISKEEAKADGNSTIYGNVFQTNLARATWELKRTDRRTGGALVEAALIHQKSNIGRRQDPIAINYSWNDAERIFAIRSASILANPELARYDGFDTAVLSYLQGEPRTVAQLIGLMGLPKTARSEDKLNKTLADLAGRGVARAKMKTRGAGKKPWGYYLADQAERYSDLFTAADQPDQEDLDDSPEN